MPDGLPGSSGRRQARAFRGAHAGPDGRERASFRWGREATTTVAYFSGWTARGERSAKLRAAGTGSGPRTRMC